MKPLHEIQKMFDLAVKQAVKNSRVFNMTYEQGVEAALGWVLEEFNEEPIEEMKK